MKGFLKVIMVLVGTVTLTGCAHNLDELRQEVASLRVQVAELQRKLNDYEARLGTIDNRLLVVEGRIEHLTQHGTNRKANVKNEVKRLTVVKLKPSTNPEPTEIQETPTVQQQEVPKIVIEGRNAHVERHQGRPKTSATKPSSARRKSNSVKELFNQGVEFYRQKRYNEAIAVFIKFLRRHPASSLADDAVYYTGLCYLEDQEYALALDEFKRVLEYENTDRIPDALLGIALCYIGLNNKKEAEQTLKTLVKRYPSTQAAQQAQEVLEKLSGSRRKP